MLVFEVLKKKPVGAEPRPVFFVGVALDQSLLVIPSNAKRLAKIL